MTETETVDQKFDRWTARLKDIIAMRSGPEQDEAWKTALNEMAEDDPDLALRHDNCVDGCCPTGEFLLLRLVHPQVSAAWMVRTFPELIPSSQTHRAVLYVNEDDF
jgi:hypothetical protein